MSAPTVAVRYLLARAAVRSVGVLHVVSERNTGAFIPVCGADQIRSKTIETLRTAPADLRVLCPDCSARAVDLTGIGSVGPAIDVFMGRGSTAAAAARLLEVPVGSVLADDLREAGEDLISSVSRDGVVTPILVRFTAEGLRLVDGGRRLDAARAAGQASIPAVVRALGDEEAVVQALLANLHRRDLDPIAQAIAYEQACTRLGLKRQALADGLGISRSQVSNTIGLLELPEHLREHVAAGTITAEQGRALRRVSDPDEQDALADSYLEQRAARKGARAPKPDAAVLALAQLLGAQLDVQKVRVTMAAARPRVVLDLADVAELQRVVAALGARTPEFSRG